MDMFGLAAELLLLLFYFVLAVPALLIIILLLLRGREYFDKGLIHLFLALLPLTAFLYFKNATYTKEQMQYVGVYRLTNYKKTKGAYLFLNKANAYEVKKGRVIVEKGDWEFNSGGDYWIVNIGEYGQLETGDFAYDIFKRK